MSRVEGGDGGSCGGWIDGLVSGLRMSLVFKDGILGPGDGATLQYCLTGCETGVVRGRGDMAKLGEGGQDVANEKERVGRLARLFMELDLISERMGAETIFLGKDMGGSGEVGLEVGFIRGKEKTLYLRLFDVGGGLLQGVRVRFKDGSLEASVIDRDGIKIDWDERVWGVVHYLLPGVMSPDAEAVIYPSVGGRLKKSWGELRDKLIRWEDVDGYPFGDTFTFIRYGNEFVGDGLDDGGRSRTKGVNLGLRVN
jgi:hypothetical protein